MVGALYRVRLGESLSRGNPVAFVKDCYVNACQIESHWRQRHGLTPARSAALVKVLTFTARNFFFQDPECFRDNLKRLSRLKGRVPLRGLRLAGVVARIIGHRQTVSLVKSLRVLRHRS